MTKDKNGIELKVGDYVKIVVRVLEVSNDRVLVSAGESAISLRGKSVEAVVYNPDHISVGAAA